MNAAQLSLWYDIGKRIQDARIAESVGADDDDVDDMPDFLKATEEELAAEDALWDATFATPESQAWMARMVERLKTEPTLPMFDEHGRWLLDDYTEEDFEKARVAQAAQAAQAAQEAEAKAEAE
jgi:hypothetical protein